MPPSMVTLSFGLTVTLIVCSLCVQVGHTHCPGIAYGGSPPTATATHPRIGASAGASRADAAGMIALFVHGGGERVR
jgi:hypothetical protein